MSVKPYYDGNGNQVAPDGYVFVCGACGKRSRDVFGEQRVSRGWDESCMLNAVLCHEGSIEFDASGDDDRRVVAATAVKEGFAK